MMLASVFVLAIGCQDPETTYRRQIEDLVRQHFPELPANERPGYAARLAQHIMSQSDPEHRAKVARSLPKYFAAHEDGYRLQGVGSGRGIPRHLLEEGAGIHLRQIDAVVRRGVAMDFSATNVGAIRQQYEQIFEAVRVAMRSKLAGERAETYAEMFSQNMFRVWCGQLESPLGSILDRPLEPEQLAAVLSEIDKTAQSFPVVELTEQAFIEGHPRETPLSRALDHAAYAARRLSFPEIVQLCESERQWMSSVKGFRLEELAREAKEQHDQLVRELVRPPIHTTPAPSPPPPPPPEAKKAPPEEGPPVNEAPRAPSPAPARSSFPFGVWIVVGVVALLMVAIWRRRL